MVAKGKDKRVRNLKAQNKKPGPRRVKRLKPVAKARLADAEIPEKIKRQLMGQKKLRCLGCHQTSDIYLGTRFCASCRTRILASPLPFEGPSFRKIHRSVMALLYDGMNVVDFIEGCVFTIAHMESNFRADQRMGQLENRMVELERVGLARERVQGKRQ